MKKFIAGAALVTTLFGTASAALAETAPAPAPTTTTAAPAPTTTVDTTTTTTTTTPAPAPATTDTTTTTTTTSPAPAPAPVELPAVSLTPDKIFYSLKLWIEQLQLAITTEGAAKAALLEQQAQTRLAEAKLMAEAGKNDLAQKAMEEAQAKLAEAQKAIAAAKEANQDISKLTNQVTQSEAKFTVVLSQVLEKAPEEVKTKMEPVVADLLVQVATTQDAAKPDDQAAKEAEKVAAEAKLKGELSALQPRMVLVLNAMAKASGKSLADVLVLYKQNPGLGNIAKQLNLRMGSVQHAAQIEWKKVGKDGKVEIEITTTPAAQTTTAPATTVAPATATQPTAQPATKAVKIEIKTEKDHDDDEDDDKDAVRLNIGKGHEKEHDKEHGKGHGKGH